MFREQPQGRNVQQAEAKKQIIGLEIMKKPQNKKYSVRRARQENVTYRAFIVGSNLLAVGELNVNVLASELR